VKYVHKRKLNNNRVAGGAGGEGGGGFLHLIPPQKMLV